MGLLIDAAGDVAPADQGKYTRRAGLIVTEVLTGTPRRANDRVFLAEKLLGAAGSDSGKGLIIYNRADKALQLYLTFCPVGFCGLRSDTSDGIPNFIGQCRIEELDGKAQLHLVAHGKLGGSSMHSAYRDGRRVQCVQLSAGNAL